jgi:hypothetical protein
MFRRSEGSNSPWRSGFSGDPADPASKLIDVANNEHFTYAASASEAQSEKICGLNLTAFSRKQTYEAWPSVNKRYQ